jgi:hypothetical protein
LGIASKSRSPVIPLVKYTINDLDQYTTVNGTDQVYDRNGNLTSDGAYIYRYDSMDPLVRVMNAGTGQNVVQFYHDAYGRRILEIEGGMATHLVHTGTM